MSKRIAIVGGGPAGSAFALNLITLGVDPGDVVIIDKAAFPRPKLCGGGLTHRATELLEALVGSQPAEGGVTMGLDFRCALGRFEVREKGPQWLYDRAHLDDLLLRTCQRAGVEIRESTAVIGLEPTAGGHRIVTKSGTEEFAWVVGADGARGLCRRAANLPEGIVGRLVEGVYESVSASVDPSTLYFDFDPILDGIPGYAWIFPYPKPGAPQGPGGLFKLGIMDGRGVVPGSRLRAWTEAYAERNGFRRVDAKLGGWPEHYYARTNRAHREGLVLVGEAWGVDPLLGEGIGPAFETAKYAARRVKEALDAGVRRIPRYELGFLFAPEGQNLWFQSKLADLLYGPTSTRWLRVLFDNRYMHRLAASGEHCYGRLSARAPSLMASYGMQLLSKGLPPVASIATPPR
jgi:flavin-dependent dehydrogenase